MHVEIANGELKSAVAVAAALTGRRSTAPVAIHASPEGIAFVGGDWAAGQWVRYPLDGVVTEPGSAVALGSAIASAVKGAKGGTATVTGETIAAGVAMVPLAAPCPPEELPFPVIVPASAPSRVVDAADLATALNRVAYAMSKDPTRLTLAGALLEYTPANGWRLVATDGHRLALAPLAMGPADEPVTAIIPAAVVAAVRKALGRKPAGPARIAWSTDTHGCPVVRFELPGGVTVTARCIDAAYPDYRRVIPKRGPHALTLDAHGFAARLRACGAVNVDRTHGVRLTCTGADVEIYAANGGGGEARDTVPGCYSGPRLIVGFNATYLADALEALPADARATIALRDDVSPALLHSDAAPGFAGVIMPMRL